MESPESGEVVLVTGASGYLGGALCRALVDRGIAVRVLVRRTSDVSNIPISSVEVVYGDTTDYTSVAAAVAGCSIVFHVAALVEPWLPDSSKFTTVNVGGLKNILQACREVKSVKKIIYTSSFFAIGPTDGFVADENKVHPRKSFCTEYEKSKVMADDIALQAAKDGLPVILLYPGVIYGSGKLTTGNMIAQIMIERFNGRLPGYMGHGKDKFSCCHVDDVVDGHIAAMHKGRVGERYLLTGENASFNAIFDLAANITNTRKPMFHIPLWLIEMYGWMSVLFYYITRKLPKISYPTARVLGHQWAYSCVKAKEELGYNPRSLKEGLSEILLWLKNMGKINY